MTDLAASPACLPPTHRAVQGIVLRFSGVSFSYGSLKVLEEAAFHIHQGECIALVGPNGSGKTTVLKLLMGLEKPQAGTIELFGGPVEAGRARLGYVPQQGMDAQGFPISVREVVRLGRLQGLSRRFTLGDRGAVEAALNQAEIQDLADRPYRGLSGGQRRRVLVARALAAQSDMLILDEPTANMDRESEERLFHTLGKLKGGIAVLIVTHDTGFVSPLVDRVLCMGRSEGAPIVQHPLEADTGGFRILHGESIPADHCVLPRGGHD